MVKEAARLVRFAQVPDTAERISVWLTFIGTASREVNKHPSTRGKSGAKPNPNTEDFYVCPREWLK
jgi:hypothetical protein